MLFNYSVGYYLGQKNNKVILLFGVSSNILLLGYFKYTDFLIENFNWAFNQNIELLHLALPLAISYFTFQQIAFLVDSYRGETREYNFVNYAVFITFFPQLLMGPIVHHKELIPQFTNIWKALFKWQNLALGLFIFSIGLAKKTILGDPLTSFSEKAFENVYQLSMLEAWYASLSYVLAYYFDLSGYADMAIGLGAMFNIKIPMNFNSPYKARNFAEYWQRWHITLSRFLGDYVYKSLGGNKRVAWVIYINILVTFLISGLWHGAGWTFVCWGILNGIFVVIAHVMKRAKVSLNFYLAWFLMFMGVIVTRILFVSDSFESAWYVIYSLFDVSNFRLTGIPFADKWVQTPLILVGLAISLFCKNSMEISENFKPNIKYCSYTILLFTSSLFTFTKAKEFLYFQF